MNWLEYLDWRFYHWRNRRPCRKGFHDLTGPHECADGQLRYTCTRCTYRFLADKLMRLP